MPQRAAMYPQTCLARNLIVQNLQFYEPRGVLYVNNAKSGCSTVKAALLRSISRHEGFDLPDPIPPKVIHGDGPYWSRRFQHLVPGKTFTFSVVRNPFTRILSAYLDKVRKKGLLRNQFYWQNGIEAGADLSFEEFLALLDPARTIFDQHWRPQVSNLLVGQIDLTEIHFLETFHSTSDALARQIGMSIEFVARDTHGTGASERLAEHLTPNAVDRIREIYADDFEVFGYSTDPNEAEAAPARPIGIPAGERNAYTALAIIGAMASKQPVAEVLPDRELTVAEKVLVRTQRPGFVKRLEELAATGTVAERYLALGALTNLPNELVSDSLALEALREQVHIAPYVIATRAGLIRKLLSAGLRDEAEGHLQALKISTWQHGLVEQLTRELAAA